MARSSCIGRSGTGKSWYSGKIFQDAAPNFENAIHLDVENEERVFSEKGENPFLRAYYVDGDMLENREVVKDIIYNKKVRVVPDGLTVGEIQQLGEEVAKAAMTLGNVIVFIDEAHVVIPNNRIGEYMERMVTGGRKRGVEMLFATQRLQKIDETVLTQSDRIIIFAVQGDNDIAKLKGFGVPDDAIRVIAGLGKREAVVLNTNSGEWEKITTESMSRKRPHKTKDDGLFDKYLPI